MKRSLSSLLGLLMVAGGALAGDHNVQVQQKVQTVVVREVVKEVPVVQQVVVKEVPVIQRVQTVVVQERPRVAVRFGRFFFVR